MGNDRESLSAVQQARRAMTRFGSVRERTVGDFERVTLPEGDCDALRDLLISESARSVIEVGLAYGSSALAIGEALTHIGLGTKHMIIDPYQNAFNNAGWAAIESAGLTTICTLIAERSQVALPRFVTENLVVDAAFVDGSHLFHNVFVDLYFLREIVHAGGLMILDDYQWPSVATAVQYFEINGGWQPQPIQESTRLRAFRLPDPPFEPSLEDFKPFGLGEESIQREIQ